MALLLKHPSTRNLLILPVTLAAAIALTRHLRKRHEQTGNSGTPGWTIHIVIAILFFWGGIATILDAGHHDGSVWDSEQHESVSESNYKRKSSSEGAIWVFLGLLTLCVLRVYWTSVHPEMTDTDAEKLAPSRQSRPSAADLPSSNKTSDDIGANSSPLIAAYSGTMEFVVPFLKAGGPVDFADANGHTMLHAAADGWQHRMVQFLILSGADPNARDKLGSTPLHLLTYRREIPEAGVFIVKEERLTARAKTFSELLLRRADPGVKDSHGGTPLHRAASEGDLEAVNSLVLSRGRSVIDETTDAGATALLLAVLGGHTSCAARLIRAGADPDKMLRDGLTVRESILASKDPRMRELAVEQTRKP